MKAQYRRALAAAEDDDAALEVAQTLKKRMKEIESAPVSGFGGGVQPLWVRAVEAPVLPSAGLSDPILQLFTWNQMADALKGDKIKVHTAALCPCPC